MNRNQKLKMRDPHLEKPHKQWAFWQFSLLSSAVILCCLALSFALNPQGWLKKAGKQRGRKVTQKHTTIAAVRGIDEPSQVDPQARNFEAVDHMEKRNVAPEKITQFSKEGKLAKIKIGEAKP